MINSPIDFFLLLLNIISAKPIPIRGIDNAEISTLNPRREINQAVTVVPIFAPIITPTDWARLSKPAFTKLTTITVVALEDWMIEVMRRPVSTLLNEFEVMAARKLLILSPATF